MTLKTKEVLELNEKTEPVKDPTKMGARTENIFRIYTYLLDIHLEVS